MDATCTLILGGHYGRYLPQVWAERYGEQAAMLACVDQEDVQTLLKGPDHWEAIPEEYDEAWCSVLDSYCHSVWTKEGFDRYYYYLFPGYCGDLFEVNQLWFDQYRDD